MKTTASERFAAVLSQQLNRIYNYCTKQIENELIMGACTVNPKHASVPLPTKEIQTELERRAIAHFEQTDAIGYYFRYWTPPIRPEINLQGNVKSITADDYQMTSRLPRFDDQWQQIILARSMIYCPLDYEQHGWSDWFELQLEAIRLTPLLHENLKELQSKFQIEITLAFPAKPIFRSFISEYELLDRDFPEIARQENNLKGAKNEDSNAKKNDKDEKKDDDLKIKYRLAFEAVKSAKTLRDLYIMARKKATSTRNQKLKYLF